MPSSGSHIAIMEEIFRFYLDNHPEGKNRERCQKYILDMMALIDEIHFILLFLYQSYQNQLAFIKYLTSE